MHAPSNFVLPHQPAQARLACFRLSTPCLLSSKQVPSFDSGVAMELINQELGRPWQEVYSELRWVGGLGCGCYGMAVHSLQVLRCKQCMWLCNRMCQGGSGACTTCPIHVPL